MKLFGRRSARSARERSIRATGARLLAVAGATLLVGTSCTGDIGAVVDDEEVSETADPEQGIGERSITSYRRGSTVKVCRVYVGLNCRSGPSTRYRVLRVLRGGTRGRVLARSGHWYRLSTSGTHCWSYGHYLCAASSGSSSSSSSSTTKSKPSSSPSGWNVPSAYRLSRSGVLRTARAYVGFSYWWGGARLPYPHRTRGASRGRCYRSSYSGHRGRYGADCSGFVGDVWQLPAFHSFTSGAHPYSTWHFYHRRTRWRAVSRHSSHSADALVYRSSRGGHVLILQRWSGWGRAYTYEARGCRYGIQHNLRTLSSRYVARRRRGL